VISVYDSFWWFEVVSIWILIYWPYKSNKEKKNQPEGCWLGFDDYF